MSVNNAEYHDRVRGDAKEHTVWKTMNDSASHCAMNLWKALGPGENFGNGQLDSQSKFLTEPWPLSIELLPRLK